MSVTEWVKSTDRLPELIDLGLSVMSSDRVLLYFDEQMKIARLCIGKYSDSKSYWSSNGYIIPIEDTYWMPLPKKPGESDYGVLYVKTEYTSGVDITAGKFYPVMSSCERSQTHNIIDDAGYSIWVRTNKPCAHLEDIGSFVLYENVKMYWSKNEREN